jgi:hypothetical protein
MKLELDLPDTQAERLHTEAQRLGVAPQALAVAAIVDLLRRSEADFSAAAEYVLQKNRELYKRLA